MFREALRAATERARLGFPSNHWSFIDAMMPERIMSAFYSVFGYGAYSFLDTWFEKKPNANHKNLAELVRVGHIENIVTLNFDFLLEAAWHGRTQNHTVPITAYPELSYAGDSWLHKPHGTLEKDGAQFPPRERYGNLQFTVERIGTTLDGDLVSWFQHTIGDKPLLVTGYSAGDLDCFPALCAARRRVKDDGAAECGRVYWNYMSKGELNGTVGLRRWLRALTPEWCPLPGPLENHLTAVLPKLGLQPEAMEQQTACQRPEPRLGKLAEDTHGLLLAGALLMHASNHPDQHAAIEKILRYLEPPDGNVLWPDDYRKATMFSQLRGDRFWERGNASQAARHYTMAIERLGEHRDDEPLGAEISRDQVRCKLAHAKVAPLRRVSPGLDLLRVPGGLFELWSIAAGRKQVEPAARRLASHFLGDVYYTLGMYFDVVFPRSRIAAALYRRGLKAFRRATVRCAEWRPRDVFHSLRSDETWLLLCRLDPANAQENELESWEKRFAHYRYIGSVLEDDVHLAAFRGVAAVRDAMKARTTGKGNLQRVWENFYALGKLYKRRGYGAGVARLQMYIWLSQPPTQPATWRSRLERIKALLELKRDPMKRCQVLLGDLQERLRS